jgi:deazaflavin-dependent oxidoreductase (nitroreductase family)
MANMTNAYHPRSSEQVALYEATDGREGGILDGRPVVILTTIGAKTGNIRKNPVMRIKDGDTYVAVASNGGATSNPSWYHNLSPHPEVLLQDGTTVYRLRVLEVRGEEKARWRMSPNANGPVRGIPWPRPDVNAEPTVQAFFEDRPDDPAVRRL